MTIFEAYNYTKENLRSAGIEDFIFESKQIIMNITGYSATKILTNYTEVLNLRQQTALNEIINQRKLRYPLQYVLGTWDFYGRAFSVGPGVLIPRADTETVIEEALSLLKENDSPEILDLCAGSGCIGITLAKEKPQSRVTLVEKYDEALKYTNENVKLNAADNVRVLQGDVFETAGADRKYDLIVSNPPYIPDEEMKLVSPEVKYEPQTALKADDGGMRFYKQIINGYKDLLNPGGAFCFETGFSGGRAVAKLLSDAGFENINTRNDLNGICRAVSGKINNTEVM